jgi:FkbM family methyltransferase
MKTRSTLAYIIELIRTVKNWPVYLLNRARLIKSDEITYRFRNGINLTTRSFAVDRLGINEVWLDHVYDPAFFPWSTCKTIIDIGANVGSFTLRAASLSPARIFAFEPDPATANVLRKNILNNSLQDRVSVVEAAISDKAGSKIFYVTPGCSLFGTLHQPRKNEFYHIQVQTISLADIFEKFSLASCDILKMDCEGAEYEILYGAPRELFQKINTIVMEYHDIFTDQPRTPIGLQNFLTTLGFTITLMPNAVLHARRRPS